MIIHWTGAAWRQGPGPGRVRRLHGRDREQAGVWATSSEQCRPVPDRPLERPVVAQDARPAGARPLEGVTTTAAHRAWAVGTTGVPPPFGTFRTR